MKNWYRARARVRARARKTERATKQLYSRKDRRKLLLNSTSTIDAYCFHAYQVGYGNEVIGHGQAHGHEVNFSITMYTHNC